MSVTIAIHINNTVARTSIGKGLSYWTEGFNGLEGLEGVGVDLNIVTELAELCAKLCAELGAELCVELGAKPVKLGAGSELGAVSELFKLGAELGEGVGARAELFKLGLGAELGAELGAGSELFKLELFKLGPEPGADPDELFELGACWGE